MNYYSLGLQVKETGEKNQLKCDSTKLEVYTKRY